MDLRTVVAQALVQLGVSPLAVAETLAVNGFQSECHETSNCPVAAYLSTVLKRAYPDDSARVSVSSSMVSIELWQHGSCRGRASMLTPSPVRDFIELFDAYTWPIDPALCWVVELAWDTDWMSLVNLLRRNDFAVATHHDRIHFDAEARDFLENLPRDGYPHIDGNAYVDGSPRALVYPARKCVCDEWWAQSDRQRTYAGLRRSDLDGLW